MRCHPVRAMIACALVLFGASRVQAQVTWYSYGFNPLAYNLLEPSVLYDSAAGHLTMWCVSSSSGVKKAISTDGSNWFYRDSAVFAQGQPGMFDRYIHMANVIRHGGKYWMYYSASRNGDSLSIGLATSLDGDHWQKNGSLPVLSPGQQSAWDSRSVAHPKVTFADGMFMMWYAGWDGVHVSTGFAVSLDGVSWTKDARNPVLRYGNTGAVDAKEAAIMGLTNWNGLYFMLYRSTDSVALESFSLATSADGATWTKYAGNPVKRLGGWDAYGVGGGTLLWLNGMFNFWYCGNMGGSWGLGQAISGHTPLLVEEGRQNQVSATHLMQNYPNPFNPSTEIGYALQRPGLVTLRVYDLLGREVATLVNEHKPEGTHTVRFDAGNLASGFYVYRMQVMGSSGGGEVFVAVKRLLVLK